MLGRFSSCRERKYFQSAFIADHPWLKPQSLERIVHFLEMEVEQPPSFFEFAGFHGFNCCLDLGLPMALKPISRRGCAGGGVFSHIQFVQGAFAEDAKQFAAKTASRCELAPERFVRVVPVHAALKFALLRRKVVEGIHAAHFRNRDSSRPLSAMMDLSVPTGISRRLGTGTVALSPAGNCRR